MTQTLGPPPTAENPPTGEPDPLVGHITDNIESIAAFQLREEQKLGHAHRRLGWVGDVIGRPGYLLVFLMLLVSWIAVNELAPRVGWASLDPPPFVWLQGFLTLVSVLTTTLVLIAHNRHARLDNSRGHLDLQLNLLTEQKVTKLIHLLEELRHDLPMVADRHDSEALALQRRTDPAKVLSALEPVVAGVDPRAPTPPTPTR